MKKLILIFSLMLFPLFASSQGMPPWAKMKHLYKHMPEVMKALTEAKEKPIKLSEKQTTDLLDALSGPVKDAFDGEDMKDEVWASWSTIGTNLNNPDKVTFIRYDSEDDFQEIVLDSDGQLIASGFKRKGSKPGWVE